MIMEIITSFSCEIDNSLSETERLLKDFYETNAGSVFEQPRKITDVLPLLKSASLRSKTKLLQLNEDYLIENLLIGESEDAAVYKHLRYLPAIEHSHEFFELCCLLEGNCCNYIQNQKVNMVPGDICIIPPDIKHAISACSDDCLIINILLKASTFTHTFMDIISGTDLLADFFTRILYHSNAAPFLLFHTYNDSSTKNFILFAYAESSGNHRYKRRMLNSIITALFITLLRYHEQDVFIPSISDSEMDKNLLFILHYIQDHYTTVTLKELSDFFHYSERHLQRTIKSALGMSFRELIQKLKMNEAAKLLKNKENTVASIAEELGYLSVNNFRNMFQKYYGVTPAEYRSQNFS
jgi:AraC-like DNA-binding protein/cupin superfamily acireductone dioxygenase involved in methionine salvage